MFRISKQIHLEILTLKFFNYSSHVEIIYKNLKKLDGFKQREREIQI